MIGRITTGAYYDYQKVRIASMNRVRDVIRKRVEGIPFDAVEDKKEDKKYEKKYTDGALLKMWNDLFKNDKITKEEHNYILKCWEIMKESRNVEEKYKTMMMVFIRQESVYHEFLSKVKGIGPVISANLIKEFGDCRVMVYSLELKDPRSEDSELISKLISQEGDDDFEVHYLHAKGDSVRYKIKGYPTISKLWAHTGNNVTEAGKAPQRRKGETITYNPRLRSMTWNISDSLLKHNKAFYRKIYDTEKEKQLNRIYLENELKEKYGKPYKEEEVNLRQGHAHNRALRKMRKIFLDHYWHASRELAGLPAKKNYVEGVLLHTNIVTWKDAIKMEEIKV